MNRERLLAMIREAERSGRDRPYPPKPELPKREQTLEETWKERERIAREFFGISIPSEHAPRNLPLTPNVTIQKLRQEPQISDELRETWRKREEEAKRIRGE